MASDAAMGRKKEKVEKLCCQMVILWQGKHFLTPEPLATHRATLAGPQNTAAGGTDAPDAQSETHWKSPALVAEGVHPCLFVCTVRESPVHRLEPVRSTELLAKPEIRPRVFTASFRWGKPALGN